MGKPLLLKSMGMSGIVWLLWLELVKLLGLVVPIKATNLCRTSGLDWGLLRGLDSPLCSIKAHLLVLVLLVVILEDLWDKIFELEEVLRSIKEESKPFDKRKEEINNEIENNKKKIEMLLEKKNIFESDKKAIEEREAIAESAEEKRAIEKERWKIEDQIS